MTEDKRFWNIRPESRRIAHPQKVYLKFPNSDEFIEEYLVDLSMTGMFVRCMNPQEAGSTFSFKMRLSAGASTVQGTAEVVWVRQDQHRLSHPKGMGVRFVHLEPDSRRQIQETVERYAQDPGEPQEMTHLRSVVEETLGEVLSPSNETIKVETGFASDRPEMEEASDALASSEVASTIGDRASGDRAAVVAKGSGSRSRWIAVAAILLFCAGLGAYFWGQGRRASQDLTTVAEGRIEPSKTASLETRSSPVPDPATTSTAASEAASSVASSITANTPSPPPEGAFQGASEGEMQPGSPPGDSVGEEPPLVTEPPVVAQETTSVPAVEDPELVLLKTVQEWASAWSKQDVESYLSFYSDRFRPARGLSLAEWRNQRRDRLKRPSFVSVTVESSEVSAQPNGSMNVRFVQTYRSNTLDDTIWKVLELTREGESWKILRERVDS